MLEILVISDYIGVRAKSTGGIGVEYHMRTFALALIAILLAAPYALAQVGTDQIKVADRTSKPIQTAAIHPRLKPANEALDAIGRPMARGPITRQQTLRSAITQLFLTTNGQLSLKGYGHPGSRLVVILNHVRLAAITVDANSRWQVVPKIRVLPGNYRFSLEQLDTGLLGNTVTDQVRISVPSHQDAPINVQFKQEEALKRHAEQVGQEASKVFDQFFHDKPAPQTRLAQSNANNTGQTEPSEQPILDATLDWLGTANQAYQRQIVPRLQIGGALSLPNNVTVRSRSRSETLQFSAWTLPSVDSITNNIQEWFGNSANSYDGQIIPRLSGAQERRIVIQRTVETEVVRPAKRIDEDQVARRAEDERRQAELRRQRELAAERAAQRDRERQLAAQQAEQTRLEEERRRTQEELRRAEAARLRAAAERKRAEEAQRTAELTVQREIEDERARVNRELLEQKRRRDAAIAAAKAERERAQKLLEDARQARQAARDRELARIRREREQRQAEEEQQRTRLSELWQRAKRAARNAVARTRAEQDPENQLVERQAPPRSTRVARRNTRTRPPAPPTQNRFRTLRRDRRIAATSPPIPDRTRRPQRTQIAAKIPVRRKNAARRVKVAKAVTKPRKRTNRVRLARKASTKRRKRVLAYRRRSHPCRKWSARRIRLPGKYVVRKGDSLWRISRRHYRRGHKYWRIYRANLGKIRNPNLIYPCQRFYIPNRKSRRK
ncbi:MAG: LysM peptidoglycan-binding domain-containing protein [Pseudomonadota bacterium]